MAFTELTKRPFKVNVAFWAGKEPVGNTGELDFEGPSEHELYDIREGTGTQITFADRAESTGRRHRNVWASALEKSIQWDKSG